MSANLSSYDDNEEVKNNLEVNKLDDIHVTHPIHIYELFNMKFYDPQ